MTSKFVTMNRAIAAALILAGSVGSAQVTIRGKTKISGGIEVNYPFTHTVQIMAYNPPAFGLPDYSNFVNDVMTQPYVDGVTLELVWSNIETAWPSTPCAPINTDVCQLDSAGFYHNYNWTIGATAYDQFASMTYPKGILQWFTPFMVNGVSTPKKVNFVLVGINILGGVNTATPEYVTSPAYVANFPSPQNRQDVMNTVLDCTNLAWKPITGATLTKGGTGGTTITVSASGCCNSGSSSAFQTNDTVWVVGGTGLGSTPYNTQIPSTPPWTPGGASITVTPGLPNQFTYTVSTAPTDGTCNGCAYITSSQSTPVPYELPYVAAWKAFMAAANLHYNPSYSVSGIGVVGSGTGGTNQLGYVRSGTWVGGESFAQCISGGVLNGLTGLPSPYGFQTSPNTWLADYQNKVSYVQSIAPTMARYWPIDNGTDPDTMASIAVGAGNGFGYINGFGSQGLSLLDTCSQYGSAGDWCYEFTNPTNSYFVLGMPLELQQIAISDPDVNPCTSTPPQCGTPPNVSGDLRGWLPFAVAHNATVIEMYYQDLGLAFDENYCDSSGSNCYHLPTINTNPNPYTWYCEVGYGAQYGVHTCSLGCHGSGCYSTAIIAAHGPQQ